MYQPPQGPQWPPPYGQQYPPPYQQPPKKSYAWLWLVIGITLFVVVLAGVNAGSQSSTTTISDTPTQMSQVHYPPTTGADLHGLAAQGDASAIHQFYSEIVGLAGVCPEQKREVAVDPRVTGKQLAEDLLAYFYAQQLDNPCGSLVLAYHQKKASDVYTAGLINYTVTNSSGEVNIDPNATSLTRTLTLDIGGFSKFQEYVVTY